MSINDIFESQICTIGQFKRIIGETKARAVMCMILNDATDQFNVGKTMGVEQVARLADMILEDFGYFKIDDFKLAFKKAIKGEFGKSYDRIDAQIILGWLEEYQNQRMNQADEINYSSHASLRSYERSQPSLDQIIKERATTERSNSLHATTDTTKSN
jgi:hypothetical protein